MNDSLRLDPDAACDSCGCYGAFRFDGEILCGDCHAGRGSCCSAEFSGRPPECEKAQDSSARPGEADQVST